MRTLVVTHVYQQAKPYLTELFASIAAQTDQNFDCVAFNYGLDAPLTQFGFVGTEVANEHNLGIPDARDWALRYALEQGYELAIFIDADDVMAADRVARTKAAYSDEYGFYYTGLNLLSNRQRDFFEGQQPSQVTSVDALMAHNFVGLSHFALNVKAAAAVIEAMTCPLDVVAYDWFLTSALLLNGLKGKRVDSTTYYRIYEQNTAGFTNSLTPEKLKRTVEVKAIHYRVMTEYCRAHGFSAMLTAYADRRHHYQGLLAQLEAETPAQMRQRLTTIHPTNAYWWSAI
ncbi:glycosyltransferase family A protein [Ferrimonas sp. SCSIO 43195]|uniref:glycosyltransferase family A protein n=1 Tax=Ferrimonas sp. SCSIO 43195 TaxID=2822844 RepID=UPI002074EE31|nr:glycosyltransferase family A protein [Ferrimonas sp. SCSIO 43195]USD37742.1 glycosyltransferase family 2 protein [Ferrimonas sp. SCSIO 43195]